MKRSPLTRKTRLKSSSSLARSTPMPKGTKKIRNVNPERQAARQADYDAYMRSPEWKAKRAACLARDEYTCQECGYKKGPGLDAIGDVIEDRQLHACHKTYRRFKHELLSDLVTKCAPCHLNGEHAMGFLRPRGLRRAG